MTTRWRRAVVTGSARGIGRAFADRLIGQGVTVLGIDVRDDGSRGAARVVADLATAEGRAIAASATAAHAPDLVVLCAGIASRPPFVASDLAIDEGVVGVNLTGTIAVLHAALPSLCQRGGAAIVVSSMSAYQPNYLLPLYAATKWALAVFGRSLHRQLDGRATVTVVHPGVTRTEIWADQAAEPMSVVPERFWATPAEVAACSLDAAAHGRQAVVPGRAYRALAPLVECLPRRLSVRAAAAVDGAQAPVRWRAGRTSAAGSMVVVGDDPGAARSLVAAGRCCGMRVTVVGADRSLAGMAEHVDVDLTGADGREVAAGCIAEAGVVVLTPGRFTPGALMDTDLATIEADLDASTPVMLEGARRAMLTAGHDGIVILAADDVGLVGDAAHPLAASVAALHLRLGTSLSIEAATAGRRVAAATGSLRSASPIAGRRVMADIDRGHMLAHGDRRGFRTTELGRAVARRTR